MAGDISNYLSSTLETISGASEVSSPLFSSIPILQTEKPRLGVKCCSEGQWQETRIVPEITSLSCSNVLDPEFTVYEALGGSKAVRGCLLDGEMHELVSPVQLWRGVSW